MIDAPILQNTVLQKWWIRNISIVNDCNLSLKAVK
jgi:hypothetical protein